MQVDSETIYRDACDAEDARQAVTDLYLKAEIGSKAEAKLKRIADYLWDRFLIEVAFSYVAARLTLNKRALR